ncbi:MAG TPA: TIM barrel protein [Thermomicrobiales bacterium]|jgi:sugar phosphate isomerase/epimerase
MPPPQPQILFGLNYRDFPGNWRPAREEIAFARAHGFAAMQFHGRERGLSDADLGAPATTMGADLTAAGIVPVMEIIVRVDEAGRTEAGYTPIEVLQANLPAITALGCRCVHWHLVPITEAGEEVWEGLEKVLMPQLAAGVALGATHGFRFGIEHNEPAIPLFPTPERCAAMLAAVQGLGFVWDLNHTAPEQLDGYLALTDRMTMLHVADTPLPAVNHHLPLGLGTIDFAAHFAALRARHFTGPAILEIGGLPLSGGYGRDTDEVLVESLRQCEKYEVRSEKYEVENATSLRTS